MASRKEFLEEVVTKIASANTKEEIREIIISSHRRLKNSNYSDDDIKKFDLEVITESQDNTATLKNTSIAKDILKSLGGK